MSAPRVTIVFTTYNVERYLGSAFDAVRAQDYADFEVVVCDNGSTDGTLAICDRYAALDERFRIHRNPTNLGVSGSFARAVGLARGELLQYLFHDDLLAPAALGRCVAALDAAGPAAVLAYPRSTYIDGAGGELGPGGDAVALPDPAAWRRVARYAHGWNMCAELSGVARTAAVRRTGLLRPRLSGDVVMLVELAVLGRFVEVPDRLSFYRIHEDSTYQGDRDSAEILAFLEPTAAPPPPPRRRDRPRHAGLARVVAVELLRSGHPAGTRWSCATAYLLSWWVRSVRAWLGRWRRTLASRPLPPAPWDAVGSTGTRTDG